MKNISIFRGPGITDLIFMKIYGHRKTGGLLTCQGQKGGEIEHVRDKQQIRLHIGSQKYPIFETAREKLGDKIAHYGYVKEFTHYAQWLHHADIIPMTSHQEFFGASLVEALYCGCYPLLPNRLTYPELIPQETYPELFYQNFDELVEKLAGALLSIETIRKQNFGKYVEQYAWQKVAPAYDAVFGAV